MAATHELGSQRRRHVTVVAIIAPVLTLAVAAALFAAGALVGNDDTPAFVAPASGAQGAMDRSAVIERAMADGQMWRALTQVDAAPRALPDAEVTDGVFPLPAVTHNSTATTGTPATGDPVLDASIAELLMQHMYGPAVPAARDAEGLPPAPAFEPAAAPTQIVIGDPLQMVSAHEEWIERGFGPRRPAA